MNKLWEKNLRGGDSVAVGIPETITTLVAFTGLLSIAALSPRCSHDQDEIMQKDAVHDDRPIADPDGTLIIYNATEES